MLSCLWNKIAYRVVGGIRLHAELMVESAGLQNLWWNQIAYRVVG